MNAPSRIEKLVLQRPPSLLALLRALEANDVTCQASRRITIGEDTKWLGCVNSLNPDTLPHAQRILEDFVDCGLFGCGPFIERLSIIAQAVCCQRHQVNEITQYYTYFWIADELLLDDFPGGREWEADEIALFSLNTDRLQHETTKANPLRNTVLCAIDRLRIYIEAVDDFERDDLYQGIMNLTMQWLATQAPNTCEPLKGAQDGHGPMRARSASTNGKPARTVPDSEPLSFGADQSVLYETLDELDRLDNDSMPRFANDVDNTGTRGSSLTSKSGMSNSGPGSSSTTANAPEKLGYGGNSTMLHVGCAAKPSQTPNAQGLEMSPIFMSGHMKPSDQDSTSQASHFTFDSDVDRFRRLLDPTKIALEVLELLQTPIVMNLEDPALDKGFLLISQFHFLPGHIRIGRSTRGPRTNLPWSCEVLKSNEPRATFIWIGCKHSQRVREILHLELLNMRRKVLECSCKAKIAPDWFEINLEDAVKTANKWVEWIDQEPFYRTGGLKARYVQTRSPMDQSQILVLEDGIMSFPVKNGSSNFAPSSDKLPIRAASPQLARPDIRGLKRK